MLEVETAVEVICPSMLVATLKLPIEPENMPIMFEMVPIAEHVDEQASPHVRKAAAWTALAASEKTGASPIVGPEYHRGRPRASFLIQPRAVHDPSLMALAAVRVGKHRAGRELQRVDRARAHPRLHLLVHLLCRFALLQ